MNKPTDEENLKKLRLDAAAASKKQRDMDQQQREHRRQEAENKQRLALLPGNPIFDTSPMKRPQVEDAKFIEEQKNIFRQFLRYIDGAKITPMEKKDLRNAARIDQNNGIIHFSSIAAAVQFVEMNKVMNREVKFNCVCTDPNDAMKVIRDMKKHGILNNITQLSFSDGRKPILGPELDDMKKRATRPSPKPKGYA